MRLSLRWKQTIILVRTVSKKDIFPEETVNQASRHNSKRECLRGSHRQPDSETKCQKSPDLFQEEQTTKLENTISEKVSQLSRSISAIDSMVRRIPSSVRPLVPKSTHFWREIEQIFDGAISHDIMRSENPCLAWVCGSPPLDSVLKVPARGILFAYGSAVYLYS